MNYEKPRVDTDVDQRCGYKCVSWSAVIVGAFVAIGLSFLLNLFGVAIGLTAFTTSAEGVKALAIGGYIGMAIASIIAMFVAGWVSGFLGRAFCGTCNLGVIYGFTTWALALVLSILLASSVGQFMAMQYDAMTDPGAVAIKISNKEPGTAGSTRTASNASSKENKNVITADTDATKALGKTVFLIFLLFFVGALASAFGGYVGVGHCGRNREVRP